MFATYLLRMAVLVVGLAFATPPATSADDDPFGDGSPRPAAKPAPRAPVGPSPRVAARPANRKQSPPEKKRVAPPPDPALYRYWPSPSGAENYIEAALKAPTPPIEFVETPLKDVVEYLKDAARIEIQLDDAAGLKEAGVEAESQITKNIRGVPLECGLNMILDEIGLGWEVRNDVVFITSHGRLAGHRTTKLYEVGDLVAVHDDRGSAKDDYDTLIKVITATVAPDSWDAKAAPASIKGATLGGAKVLSVFAPCAVHRELAEYLANIRRIAKRD